MALNDTPELAQSYVSQNTTQHSTGVFLAERIGILPGMRVLDVGCGTGNLTSHLATLVGPQGSVVGIEPSPERIAIASSTYKAQNLSFDVGVAEDLSRFDDASFDVVFLSSVFHWVPDQPRAMREFARVLRAGGKLGISGGVGDSTPLYERVKNEVLNREPWRQYYAQTSSSGAPKFMKRAEFEALLRQAGFGPEGWSMVPNTVVKKVKDSEALMDWIVASSAGGMYGGVPEELRPKVRKEMVALFKELETERGIELPIEMLVIVATKT